MRPDHKWSIKLHKKAIKLEKNGLGENLKEHAVLFISVLF